MRALTKQPVCLILLAASLILAAAFAASGAFAQKGYPAGADRAEGSEYVIRHIRDLTPDQLPSLQGDGLSSLYHFAGVLNLPASGKGTAVQCTNVDATAATYVEVQLFDYTGTQVDTAAISVDPLRTVTFESTSILFYTADVPMSAGLVEQGYGRILTEHRNVVCTVQVLDAANVTPTWSMDIPVYRQGYGSLLPAVLSSGTP